MKIIASVSANEKSENKNLTSHTKKRNSKANNDNWQMWKLNG